MPDDIQTPTTPPGCAPTTGSEVPTPRTDKETWTTIAGAFKCSGANGDLEGEGEYVPTAFARQLEREAVALAESHRTLLHEAMEMSDELDAIRAVFQHGADEENWKPGTTLAEAVAKLKASAGLPNGD